MGDSFFLFTEHFKQLIARIVLGVELTERETGKFIAAWKTFWISIREKITVLRFNGKETGFQQQRPARIRR